MSCSKDYVIDKILPANLFSLTSGASDAGKSSFWFLALAMIEAGCPVLGLDTRPIPFTIVSYDRTLKEVRDVLERIGLDPRATDVIPAFGADNKTMPQVWIEIEQRKHKEKIVLWEGIDGTVRHRNDAHEVRELCSEIAGHCQDEHITLIGTGGIAKLKPWEMYDDPRQLAAGSEWWGRSASTMFVMRKWDPENVKDNRRIMDICPKVSRGCRVLGRFDDSGMLEFDDYGTTYAQSVFEEIANRNKKNGHGK